MNVNKCCKFTMKFENKLINTSNGFVIEIV